MLTGLRSNLHDIAEARLDAAARAFLSDPRIKTPDFSVPEGEPALVSPDSVSWRIFKNPVTLFIGGVAAVFMEFADPRVRAGRLGALKFSDRSRLAIEAHGARGDDHGLWAEIGRGKNDRNGDADARARFR